MVFQWTSPFCLQQVPIHLPSSYSRAAGEACKAAIKTNEGQANEILKQWRSVLDLLASDLRLCVDFIATEERLYSGVYQVT